jgi:hypothetical protein
MHGSFNGIEEVVGSIPSGSTNKFNNLGRAQGQRWYSLRLEIATSSPRLEKSIPDPAHQSTLESFTSCGAQRGGVAISCCTAGSSSDRAAERRHPRMFLATSGVKGPHLVAILRNFSNLRPEIPHRTGHALLRREIRSIISLASSASSAAYILTFTRGRMLKFRKGRSEPEPPQREAVRKVGPT